MKKHIICFSLTLLVTVYIFNYTTIPNQVIFQYLEHDKNSNYQTMEFYLFVFNMILFHSIFIMGIGDLLESKKQNKNKSN